VKPVPTPPATNVWLESPILHLLGVMALPPPGVAIQAPAGAIPPPFQGTAHTPNYPDVLDPHWVRLNSANLNEVKNGDFMFEYMPQRPNPLMPHLPVNQQRGYVRSMWFDPHNLHRPELLRVLRRHEWMEDMGFVMKFMPNPALRAQLGVAEQSPDPITEHKAIGGARLVRHHKMAGGDLGDDIRRALDPNRNGLNDSIRHTGDVLGNAFDPNKNGLAAAVNSVGDKLKAVDWNAVKNKLGDGLDPAKNGVSEAFNKFGGDAKKAFEDLGNKIKESAQRDKAKLDQAFAPFVAEFTNPNSDLAKFVQSAGIPISADDWKRKFEDPDTYFTILSVLVTAAASVCSAGLAGPGVFAATQALIAGAKLITKAATGKPIGPEDIAGVVTSVVPGAGGGAATSWLKVATSAASKVGTSLVKDAAKNVIKSNKDGLIQMGQTLATLSSAATPAAPAAASANADYNLDAEDGEPGEGGEDVADGPREDVPEPGPARPPEEQAALDQQSSLYDQFLEETKNSDPKPTYDEWEEAHNAAKGAPAAAAPAAEAPPAAAAEAPAAEAPAAEAPAAEAPAAEAPPPTDPNAPSAGFPNPYSSMRMEGVGMPHSHSHQYPFVHDHLEPRIYGKHPFLLLEARARSEGRKARLDTLDPFFFEGQGGPSMNHKPNPMLGTGKRPREAIEPTAAEAAEAKARADSRARGAKSDSHFKNVEERMNALSQEMFGKDADELDDDENEELDAAFQQQNGYTEKGSEGEDGESMYASESEEEERTEVLRKQRPSAKQAARASKYMSKLKFPARLAKYYAMLPSQKRRFNQAIRDRRAQPGYDVPTDEEDTEYEFDDEEDKPVFQPSKYFKLKGGAMTGGATPAEKDAFRAKFLPLLKKYRQESILIVEEEKRLNAIRQRAEGFSRTPETDANIPPALMKEMRDQLAKVVNMERDAEKTMNELASLIHYTPANIADEASYELINIDPSKPPGSMDLSSLMALINKDRASHKRDQGYLEAFDRNHPRA